MIDYCTEIKDLIDLCLKLPPKCKSIRPLQKYAVYGHLDRGGELKVLPDWFTRCQAGLDKAAPHPHHQYFSLSDILLPYSTPAYGILLDAAPQFHRDPRARLPGSFT